MHGIFCPHCIWHGHRLEKLRLCSAPLLLCTVELLMQFILFHVLYDHVRFSCRIFISLLPQPKSSQTLLACLVFLPPTFPFSVTPHGGVRLFMWLLHAIHAWLPTLNMAGALLVHSADTDATIHPVACNLKGDLHASMLLCTGFYPLKSSSSSVTLLIKKLDANCFRHACRQTYSMGSIIC